MTRAEALKYDCAQAVAGKQRTLQVTDEETAGRVLDAIHESVDFHSMLSGIVGREVCDVVRDLIGEAAGADLRLHAPISERRAPSFDRRLQA